MKKNKIIIYIALLLISNFEKGRKCLAQDVDHQLWMNYALTVPINEEWTYGGDVGIRGLFSNYDWNQILIRPNVNYRINYVFSVSPAIGWFGTFNRSVGNLSELRFHQDFNVKWPDLGFAEFFYRLRVEQRWFFYQDPEIKNAFNWRFRALIGIETADIKLFGPTRPIYFQVLLEGFSSMEENAPEIFVDQARLHFAIGHRISQNLRYELYYIRQGSRLFARDGIDVSQNLYRLRLFHRLAKK